VISVTAAAAAAAEEVALCLFSIEFDRSLEFARLISGRYESGDFDKLSLIIITNRYGVDGQLFIFYRYLSVIDFIRVKARA